MSPAAAPETVRIVGLKSTVKQLRALDDGAVRRVKVINLEAAELVAEAAMARAPVGSDTRDIRPGRLKLSIRAGSTAYTAYVKMGGNAVPYAGPIHFGWRVRNIAPQPFLYEAVDVRRAEVIALFENALSGLVDAIRGGE